MKIKKYRASSMAEAMNLIKRELGSDAIILNSKEIKTGGIFGLFQKKSFEVVAAIDKTPSPRHSNNVSENNRRIVKKETNNDAIQAQLLAEIKQLQSIVTAQKEHESINIPNDYKLVYDYLLKQAVEAELAQDIIQTASLVDDARTTSIKEKVRIAIEGKLSKLHISGISFNKQIVQLVGPTGVGKTTTLAKVAAHSMLQKNKKIAFITADTYRIAAIDQLKTYARILNVPIEVAYSKEDYENALRKFHHYDIIFVDTAGRNFRDQENMRELQSVITLDPLNRETYLVVSLTAKERDIEDIYHQFKPLNIEKIIFTKLDETSSYGTILNISLKHQLNIAYITNGQDVPDDIVEPNAKYISELLMSRYDD